MNLIDDENGARLAAQASQVRREGALGRSDVLIRLFDFLLDRSLAGRVPKEVEVAQEVFGKGADFDMMQDASVRVYIHRLRRKLEEYYAGTAADADRLFIPRGEYRLAVSNAVGADVVEPVLIPMSVPAHQQRWRAMWIALALLLAANIAAWTLLALRGGQAGAFAPLTQTPLWRPLASTARPTLIVAGDYYIFGEAPEGVDVTRLVREFDINSRDDLDQYIMAHPDQNGRRVDVDLHYLPVSIAPALRNLLPVIEAAAAGRTARPRVVTMSQLTPDNLKTANIVYIGYFSALGLLRDPLFEASGFAIGGSYDELIDRATTRHYMSDWSEVADGRTPRRDYSYIASLPGPSGNRILIVAGTGDPAVMQAAEVAGDADQLKALAAKVGDSGAFEALYEVRTLGNLNLGSTLVVARPLRVAGLWKPDEPQRQTFPDQLPVSDIRAH